MAVFLLYQKTGEQIVCSRCGGVEFAAALREGAEYPYACLNCFLGLGELAPAGLPVGEDSL